MKNKMLILAFREKTGCKQYGFRNWSEFRSWRSRRPYYGEQHRVQIYLNGKLSSEFVQPSQEWIDAQGTDDAFKQTSMEFGIFPKLH